MCSNAIESRRMHAHAQAWATKADKCKGLKAADVNALASKMKCPSEHTTKVTKLTWMATDYLE